MRHAAAIRREAEASGELDLSAPSPVSRPAHRAVNDPTASPGPVEGTSSLSRLAATASQRRTEQAAKTATPPPSRKTFHHDPSESADELW